MYWCGHDCGVAGIFAQLRTEAVTFVTTQVTRMGEWGMGSPLKLQKTVTLRVISRREQVGVISIMSSPAVQCFSFPSLGERKTWLKGALASVLDRVGYFTCFI